MLLYIKENTFEKIVIILIFASSFLLYFFNGLIAYTPYLCFILFYFIFSKKLKFSIKRDALPILFCFFYSFLSLIYYLFNVNEYGYFSGILVAILTIPISFYFFLSASNGNSFDKLLSCTCKVIYLFVLFQLIICLGQLTQMLYGIGFRVPEAYYETGMISGTMSNANDLAALIILLLYIYSKFNNTNNNIYCFIFLVFLVLILTTSRSAIFLFFIILFFSYNKNIFNKEFYKFLVLILCCFVLFLYIVSLEGFTSLDRIFGRLTTFSLIIDNGLSVDNSISLRLESYIYFFSQIGNLGLGSMEINNYLDFSNEAKFEKDLIFVNPHSLFIEIAYWMGHLGFYLFISFIGSLYFNYNRSIFLIFIIIASSLISSGALWSPLYLFTLTLCFFVKSERLD